MSTGNNWQEMVREFHDKFGIPARDPASGWTKPRTMLRISLIDEEARETIKALASGDMPGVIDGICDTIYVLLGTAVEMGVDITPFFAEVHESNLRKTGGSVRGDGKIEKPPGWVGPRIAEMLKALP